MPRAPARVRESNPQVPLIVPPRVSAFNAMCFVLATRVKKQFGVPPTLRLSEVLCRLGDRDERSRTYSDDPKGVRCSSFGIRQVV